MTGVEQIDTAWPCLREGCTTDADCAGAARCGWVGDDEPPPAEVPNWDPQPIQPGEIPDDLVDAVPQEYRRTPLTEEEQAARREHLEAARRVHVRPDPPGAYARLGGSFDPRGRHVGCDGEPGPAGGMTGGCGAAPGLACRVPGGRFVPGFVHPTRLHAEMMLFGIDPA